MLLIAYQSYIHDGKIAIDDSFQFTDSNDGHYIFDDLNDLLDYMLECYDDPGKKDTYIKYCWDIDVFVAPILKVLGKDKAVSLYKNKRLDLPPYELFYIPGKTFQITHRRAFRGNDRLRAKFYGIKAFFPEGKVPKDFEELYFYGKYLWDNLKKMGFRPTKLTSPIAVFQECVMKALNLPEVIDMPQEIAELAYSCSGRLWVEAYKLGYFKHTWDYDLTSAFPRIAQTMYDTRYCDYVHTTEYQLGAEYGYIKGEITINDSVTLHPVINDRTGDLITPVGTWSGTITKQELDFINKWHIGYVDIHDAWWATPNRNIQPLKTIMARILVQKDKGGLIKHIAKLMANGIYGKFGEEHIDGFGQFFNPIWFAEISTRTRLKVCEFIYRNKLVDNVIHVGVDGVLLDKKHTLTDKEIETGWRLDDEGGEALIVSSGLAYHGDYRQAGFDIKSLKKMFKQHPGKGFYQDYRTRRVTIGDIANGVPFEQLGHDIQLPTSIDLYPDKDRVYKPKPETGGQLLKGQYKSLPVRV